MPTGIRPSDILRKHDDLSYPVPEAFVLYEHLCRQCILWHKTLGQHNLRWEVLNNTSSIRNSHLNEIEHHSQVVQRLCHLFAQVGRDNNGGEFLQFCGFRSWSDLDREILFYQRIPKDIGRCFWFDVSQRKTVKSFNPSRPEAVWASRSALQFCRWNSGWVYRIFYSYEHDDSSWCESFYQKKGESLWGFCKGVNEFIDRTLEPEGFYEQSRRKAKNRDFKSVDQAIKRIFYDDYSGDLKKLREQLLEIQGMCLRNNRIKLTYSRLKTLERWIKE